MWPLNSRQLTKKLKRIFSRQTAGKKIRNHYYKQKGRDEQTELEKLKKIIVEVLNVDEDEISEETTFIDDLGADSLDIFQIIMGIEEEFDIEIPTEEAEKISTVGDAVEQIKNALN